MGYHAGRFATCDSLNPIQEKENRLFIWIMKTSLRVTYLACTNITCTSAAGLTSLCLGFASLLFCKYFCPQKGENQKSIVSVGLSYNVLA